MSLLDDLVSDTIAICRVPAPTGQEAERGRLLGAMLEAAGAPAITDDAGNVIAEVPGEAGLPTVALAAHLDTVFPDVREIEVVTRDGWLHAPGIGDNSAGVAALVSLARLLPRSGLGRVLLVGTVGEEGNGDLRGVRHLFARDDHGIDAIVAVEGAAAGRMVTGAVGAERLRVTIRGPGGHSWTNCDRPSAIDGAARLVAGLYDLPRPRVPLTTLNVAPLHGGTTVNAIASEVKFDVDLRSLDPAALLDLRGRALRAVESRVPPAGPLTVDIERIGSRPAGRIAPDHPLLAHARAARAALGLAPAEEVSGSTDANVPLSLGVPATCLGVGTGADAHTLAERLRIDGLDEGVDAILETVVRVAADPHLTRG